MKVRQYQLGELWRGNAVYRLLHLKGDRSRYVITKQEPLAIDDRTFHIRTERTLVDVFPHWENLFPDDNPSPPTEPEYEPAN